MLQSSTISGTNLFFFFLIVLYLLRTISLIIDTFHFCQGYKVNIPYVVLINTIFNEVDD